MTFGFSRDDAGKFLGAYYDKKIYENDPFAKLDQVGVGKLVKWPPSWAVPPAPTCIWASAANKPCHWVGGSCGMLGLWGLYPRVPTGAAAKGKHRKRQRKKKQREKKRTEERRTESVG